MKTILDVNNEQAKEFFMKPSVYCALELPSYFSFERILQDADQKLSNSSLVQLCVSNPRVWPSDVENVNLDVFNNKKNKYQWRKFEIIHPVLYVDLVNKITNHDNWLKIRNRFNVFSSNNRIKCCSIPVYSDNVRNTTFNWWKAFEQRSISCSLDFAYMGITDIENCYPNIYTHSIAWALHTEAYAKEKANRKNPDLIGNAIDISIRHMHYGQTNGLPQGSVLMDFIAEMVLGYADTLLSEKLEENGISDYQILRYRDDYRIFASDISTVETIIKHLTIILTHLNLHLNPSKTRITSNIVIDSMKDDKVFRIVHPPKAEENIQKRLLSVYKLSLDYPNSGSVKKELAQMRAEAFLKLSKRPNSYEQMISIVVEIMRINPTVYPICIGILSDLFQFLNPDTRSHYITRIISRLSKEPFSDYLEIWLQRTTILDDRIRTYNNKLCQKVYDESICLWNSTWMQNPIDESSIIDENEIASLPARITKSEVDKFDDYNG